MPDPTKRRRKAGYYIGIALMLGILLLMVSACGGGGGGGGGGGQQYDYSVSLTPDKTLVAPGGTVNLNLHYDAPANNAGITWKLVCVQSDCGSVTASGVYTAPAQVEAQMVVAITATSKDNPSKGYYVEIWISGKIVVTIFPQDYPAIHVNESVQFTSQVNSSDKAVTWQVNGVTGGNATVGTVSTTGLYSAPAAVPDPATITITAIAHADQTATATVHTQIVPAAEIAVYITPYDASVNINSTLQYSAQVTNTNDTAVTWQVNGITGGNSTIGTISTAGLFTAPAAVPSPAVETITAVSHADANKSGLTHVTITNTTNQNALLNGPYTFAISGPDSAGAMRAGVGTLTFDGNGGFTSTMDLNSTTLTGGAQTVQYAGTYAIDQDYRGTMTFNISPALTFAFTLNSGAKDAKLMEYDTRGTHYVGSMQKQTPSELTLAKFTGDYAFQLYGVTATGEGEGAVGRFHADGAGNISDASIDMKEDGENSQSLSNLTGTAAITDVTHGRGTVTFIQSSTAVLHFSFYMSNAGDVFVLSTDPVPDDNPLLIGHVLKQTGAPFSNSSLDGRAVFTLWGNRTTASDFCLNVGQWNASGSTQLLSGNYDSNCNGTVTLTPFTFTSRFTITANGRGVLSDLLDVFYMIDKNKAFLLQTYAGSSVGMIEPQLVTTFDNSIFNGVYRIGPISMPRPGADISQGYLSADGDGNFGGAENVLGSEGPAPIGFSGNYSVDATGRTIVDFTYPETFRYVAYPVTADRFIGISIQVGDSLPNLTSLDK